DQQRERQEVLAGQPPGVDPVARELPRRALVARREVALVARQHAPAGPLALGGLLGPHLPIGLFTVSRRADRLAPPALGIPALGGGTSLALGLRIVDGDRGVVHGGLRTASQHTSTLPGLQLSDALVRYA